MNEAHLKLCSSDEWADGLRKWLIPAATDSIILGDHALEVGPGPGRTTDILMHLVPRLTAVEVDPLLAARLKQRMAGTNVTVVEADATALPFPDDHFDSALSFVMLHHVPTPQLQDQLFGEVRRVLRPGGVFAGVDSFDTPPWRELHADDICVAVPPETVEQRLRAAGFSKVAVVPNERVLQFHATV
ncbi:MAG: class I SAM-dependent methyltransferase [Dehalococcoidia bacterium]|nr:class I SAM-dependent methyltransferase [Dehalococcoidia bacterium]